MEHHAAAPAYSPSILASQTEVDVVDGPKLAITQKNNKLFVNGNEIKAAIQAKNGMVYVIDSVLVP